MNSKLLLSTALFLMISSGLSAASSLIVVNHTPYTLSAKYDMGPFGKDREVTINANQQYTFPATAEIKKLKILGIKTMAGDKYFGGSNKAEIIEDDLGSIRPGSMTWHVFSEPKIETKSGTGLTYSGGPTDVKFFLVRKSKITWPGHGGVVDESPWFSPSGTATGAAKP